jgi:hypothetical protein
MNISHYTWYMSHYVTFGMHMESFTTGNRHFIYNY